MDACPSRCDAPSARGEIFDAIVRARGRKCPTFRFPARNDDHGSHFRTGCLRLLAKRASPGKLAFVCLGGVKRRGGVSGHDGWWSPLSDVPGWNRGSIIMAPVSVYGRNPAHTYMRMFVDVALRITCDRARTASVGGRPYRAPSIRSRVTDSMPANVSDATHIPGDHVESLPSTAGPGRRRHGEAPPTIAVNTDCSRQLATSSFVGLYGAGIVRVVVEAVPIRHVLPRVCRWS